MRAKRLRVEIGYSENVGKGTWNAHITMRWPDRPAEFFYNPGEPPFKSPQDACEWARAEVRKMFEKIAAEDKRNRLIIS